MQTRDFNTWTRRRFIAAAGGFAASTLALHGRDVLGANDQVRVGLIGCGGRGGSLAKDSMGLSGVRMVAVCDPDTAHMDQVAAMYGTAEGTPGHGLPKPDKIRDYRKLLERKDIDAVIIASPNHWHALHTIHACQAGMDVYVEKPVSHDIWSSRQMIAAAERYGRVVQAGTQNRSDVGLIKAHQFIRDGRIGAVKGMRGLCFRNRRSIGKMAEPIQPPATCDYELWLGPAQDKPIYRPHLHYDWHWDYNTGNGDIGNQGPHEFDLMSWFLGDPEMPTEMYSFGGRFGWDDAGETANLQAARWTQSGVPCTFEVNNMWITPERNAAAHFKGIRVGIIVTCEGGEFRGGRGGGYVVGPDGKQKIAKFPGDGGGGHMQNFIDAVRSRRTDDLAGKLESSHKSAALAHFANISLRTGSPVPLAELPSALPQDETNADILERQTKQLVDWKVDLDATPGGVGSKLTIDPATAQITGPEGAMAFNVPSFRKGYEVPKLV